MEPEKKAGAVIAEIAIRRKWIVLPVLLLLLAIAWLMFFGRGAVLLPTIYNGN